jgi:hypothetical protein
MLERLGDQCRAVGRDPGTLAHTVAIMVRAPGGTGRIYGDSTHESTAAISGAPEIVAQRLAAFGPTGIKHAQLVVDPITVGSIEWLGKVLEILDR